MAPLILGIDTIARHQKQKAEADELRKQLDQLKKEKRSLRHYLLTEKLEYMRTQAFAAPVHDPETHNLINTHKQQVEISQQIPVVSYVRSIQEVVATYRLTGCSTFIYKKDYLGIRLDPFYNRRYYEPYYIIMDNSTIRWTSLPWFITTAPDFEDLLLPDSLDTLIRAFQDAVQAYIARREQLEEFKAKVPDTGVEIRSIGTGARLRITCHLVNVASYQIDLRYQDTGSIYPTLVKVTRQANQSIRNRIEKQGDQVYWDPQETERIINAFTTKKLLQAYRSIFQSHHIYPS